VTDPTHDPPPPSAPFDEDDDDERALRRYRKERRAARARALEIKELNITAMMDMMTIILVFLLKSYTASSLSVQQTKDLVIPASTSEQKPQDNVNITVSLAEVAVNDKRVTAVVNGTIPAAARAGGDAKSPLVEPLLAALQKEVEKQKYIARYNPAAPFAGKVNVIADKRIPYQTLIAVLYTAGQAELRQYKLLAMRGE
jgi:biopolymer transport protein ExbD